VISIRQPGRCRYRPQTPLAQRALRAPCTRPPPAAATLRGSRRDACA